MGTPPFPMPNDKHPEGIIVASVHYREDLYLATILILRPRPPYFRVGVWNYDTFTWDGWNEFEDHENIVPAVSGDAHPDCYGYVGFGGDY